MAPNHFRLNSNRRAIALMAIALLPGVGTAQSATPAPEGVLGLAATAQVEVPRDWLAVTLAASREGPEPGALQTQLNQALEPALAIARRAARPGQLEVQTGSYAIQPRSGAKGEPVGWRGRAELIVQGRDLGAIAQLVGQLGTLSVANVAYSLSREVRQQAEAEAASQAIARFRAMAADHARQFGYGGYAVREVNVGTSELPPVRPLALQMRSAAAETGAALPIEAGQGTVAVTVSGTIQMK